MRVGSNLNKLYSLGKKLGEGDFGTTFLCVEKLTGKQYACKSILKERLEKEDVEDVKREIQVMKHLAAASHRHPNIIMFKGVYEDDEAIHIVMELCEGGELFDRIQNGRYYTEEKATELARVIVGALETCHSLGVMHRDVKPENFMFVNEEEDSPIKLIDFGFSVFFKPGETFDDEVGTPEYAAPEVQLGEKYGPMADVWSAGVIIYILLCGGLPFYAETEEELFEQVKYGEIDFESDPWPSISEAAKDLVKKMLVRDPERRATAHQVLSHSWFNQERNNRKMCQ